MASLLLAIGLLAGLLPTAAMAESHTATGVRYRAYDADNRCWNDAAICPSATVVSGTDTTRGDDGNDGWYVVNSNMTIDSRVTVSGAVHLILTDGCTLTVNGGIQVQGDWVIPDASSSNSLTIHAQSTDSDMGGLTVPQLTNGNAAIGANGGRELSFARFIAINGGGEASAAGDVSVEQGQRCAQAGSAVTLSPGRSGLCAMRDLACRYCHRSEQQLRHAGPGAHRHRTVQPRPVPHRRRNACHPAQKRTLDRHGACGCFCPHPGRMGV